MPKSNRSGFSIVLVLTALALLGYLLLPRLSVRWQPGALQGQLSVSYHLATAAPSAVERLVTSPLEASFSLLEGVEKIESVSRRGSGRIDLTLSPERDPDFLRFTIAAAIRRIYPALPSGVSYPTIDYQSPEEEEEGPVLVYTLYGADPPSEMTRFANDQLLPQFSQLPQLERMELSGGNVERVRIEINPERLRQMGLNRPELVSQLRRYFQRGGLGLVSDGNNRLYCYLGNQWNNTFDPKQWETIPLSLPSYVDNARQYELGDIAKIELEEQPPSAYYRLNGENNLRLLAYGTKAANQIELALAFKQLADEIGKQLPKGYTLQLEKDNTEFLRQELQLTRRRTALSIGILLFFVLLAYRNWRKIVVVFYGLAVNLGLAFFLYYWLEVELNLYAFAGVAVSFGIMIDNILIMMDALDQKGNGKAEIPAIIGATLTSMAGLSVIFFLGEELRHQLFELSRVMLTNLALSVVVAVYFVPALEVQVGLKNSNRRADLGNFFIKSYTALLNRLIRFRKGVLFLVLLAFGLPVFLLPRQIEDCSWYNNSIGSEYYQDVLRPHVNRWLGGSLRLFSYYVYEGSGFRKNEQTRLYVRAALPEGATVHQLNEVLSQVEKYLATFGEQIATYSTGVYSGQSGVISIQFPEGNRSSFPYALKSQLTRYANNFGGVEWDVYGVGQAFSNNTHSPISSFRVEMRGYNQDGLDQLSNQLAASLLHHPRIKEVNTDANMEWWQKERTEYHLTYRPNALALAGLSPFQLMTSLEWFDRSPHPDFYLRDGMGVAIQPDEQAYFDRWNAENRSLPLDSTRLTLNQFAELSAKPAAQALFKKDQEYLRLLTFDYLGSSRFGSIYLNKCIDTLNSTIPLGYSASRPGYERNEELKDWSQAIGLAVVLIFFICALLFESLKQALSIIALIPITFIGVFLTFYYFEVQLDQGGYTSFLMVSGLAVNGMILIVNNYNGLLKDGLSRSGETFALAVKNKLLPISLTVLSTAAGLIPFLIGAEKAVFWYGLAAGTIGGLFFSVFVLLLVCPLLFLKSAKAMGGLG